MTTEELHQILDDRNKKFSVKEFQEILFQLRQDCYNEKDKVSHVCNEFHFYHGETNALQIALDLSEHITNQVEQIHSLEEQLKNSITPKFNLKQKVWFILRDGKDRDVFSGTITLITLSSYYKSPKLIYTVLLVDNDINLAEDELFATREEAEKRLAELEGK